MTLFQLTDDALDLAILRTLTECDSMGWWPDESDLAADIDGCGGPNRIAQHCNNLQERGLIFSSNGNWKVSASGRLAAKKGEL